MRSSRFLRASMLPLVFSAACFAQAAPAALAPIKQMAVPGSFNRNLSFPQAEHGYLVSHVFRVTAPGQTAILAQSLATGESTKLPFWIGGASKVFFEDAGVTPAGSLLVAGYYIRAADVAQVNFVDEVQLTGQVVNRVDTGAFTADRVCMATDGTIWTLGQEMAVEESANGRVPNYGMVRSFSIGGDLLAQFVSRSRIRQPLELRTGQPTSNIAYLRCGEKSVGVYLGPIRTYYEMPAGTGVFQSWKVQPVASNRITSLYLTDSKTVYASFRNQPSANPFRGLYVLDLAHAGTAKWIPVPGTVSLETAGSFDVLVGTDGGNLIHQKVGVLAEGAPVLFWSKP